MNGYDPEFTGTPLLNLVIAIEAVISVASAGATPLGSAVTLMCETAITKDHQQRATARSALLKAGGAG